MTTHGLFFGWDRPLSGREHEAQEIFTQSMNYFNRLRQEGKIDSVEPVLLQRHGGNLNGFILVRGDMAKLAQIQDSVDFKELVLRVDHVVSRLGVIHASVGEGVTEQMRLWSKTVLK
jgi:hypothetical protein